MTTNRYPLRNADEREAERLALLQGLSDPVTTRWMEHLGVGPGWRCAELGAGGGSMVEWLAERVGPSGSVTAVDRDTTRLQPVANARSNVTVVEADLCELALPEGAFDLVHSRSVLMHLPCPDRVVERAVHWVDRGGLLFFEETDGAPGQEAQDVPEPYRAVFGPLAAQWSWARGLADQLRALGMVDVGEDVRGDPLQGGSQRSAFWKFTLGSVVELRQQGVPGGDGVDLDAFVEALPAMLELLDDADFAAPFTNRHRVTARRPA